MGTLSTTKNYLDGTLLTQAQLDIFLNETEAFVNTTKLNDDNIQVAGLTGSTKLINSTITTAKLASNVFQTSHFIADSVTKDKINADLAGLGLGQNVDGSLELNVDDVTLEVSTDKLRVKDNSISTAKILDETVQPAKRNPSTIAVTLSSGAFSTASASFVDITNLSGSIATSSTSRKILVFLQGDSSANNSFIQKAEFRLMRSTNGGGSYSELCRWETATANNVVYSPLVFIDEPAFSGSIIYKIEGLRNTGAGSMLFHYTKLVAVEI